VTSAEILAIEHACARLIARYANANDAADWAAVADFYTETGRMARPSEPDAWIEGRAAILAAFEARPPRLTRHICANIVIDVVDDSRALGVSAITLFVPGAAPKLGSFYDRFDRIGSEWKFAERRGSIVF